MCLQAVQDALVQSAPGISSHKPHQGRAYVSQLQAAIVSKQVELAEQQLLSQQQLQSQQQSVPNSVLKPQEE